MGDKQNSVHAVRRAKARRQRPDGIIGRLTYTPANGDEAVGQIRRNRAKDEKVADLREKETDVKGHSVLAVASGVSGNVLRLMSLAKEEWIWTEADIRVRLHAANPQLDGEWHQDGMPISLVKFAVDIKKNDQIRWLLLQNGASTTVYEPELRMIPIPNSRDTAQLTGRRTGSQIFANLLFALPCERTGGSSQTDVCFTRNLNTDTPQLAIIDQAGYWSLWDITGRRNVRPKNLTPVMKMCGNTIAGWIPKLPSGSLAEPQPQNVLWLQLGQKQPKPSSRAKSALEQSRRSLGFGTQPMQRLLLLSNPKSLHLFDITSRKLHSLSHLVLQKDTHQILGVAPSRLDPAQVFILTSTTLFWVAAKKGIKDTMTLDILVSCPHQKGVNDPTLQLDVSPGAYLNDRMACFVCVRSAKDTEMSVFWFINPEPGSPALYHHNLVFLKAPSNFVGLSILPAARRMGEEPMSVAGRAMRKAQLRFFQLLTLGQDLDVHSALCAWLDERAVEVRPPDARETQRENGNCRMKLLRDLTGAFAVPVEFNEKAVFGKRGLESKPMEGIHCMLELAAPHGASKDLLQLARDWDAQQEALHRRTGDWQFPPEARRPLVDFGPDDLVERLRDLFFEPNSSPDDPFRQSRDEVLRTMAAEMFLSNIGVSAPPLPSFIKAKQKAKSQTPVEEAEQGDAVALRLRKYATLNISATAHGEPSLVLSRWDLGADPKDISWKPGQDLEAEDAINRKRRKIEARRRKAERLSQRIFGDGGEDSSFVDMSSQSLGGRSSLGGGRSSLGVGRSSLQPMILPTSSQQPQQHSQPSNPLPWDFSSQVPGLGVPPIAFGTPRAVRQGSPLRKEYRRSSGVGMGGPAMSSQQLFGVGSGGGGGVGSQGQSQGTPSQPRSQVLLGAFGGRLSPFKRSPVKKGKRKSELRLSGFR
ncbi:hypothetical protein N0V88_000252 [Collariella sp. IMI 366227]|nr:hypothetical protein N0V88_000252 [Collariella sp. IMI 366227]